MPGLTQQDIDQIIRIVKEYITAPMSDKIDALAKDLREYRTCSQDDHYEILALQKAYTEIRDDKKTNRSMVATWTGISITFLFSLVTLVLKIFGKN